MSKTRLTAALAAALTTMAFATSALAAGGGSPGDDNVTGGSRADHIALQAGDDHASGGRGDDVLSGGRGNDVLSGGRGDDVLRGGAGDDRLNGGSGDDRLSDDRGSDRMSGGAGDDRLNARDARGTHDRRDVVDCGAGDDTALVDSDDVVRNCEHVQRKADDNGVDAPGTGDNGARGGADDPAGHA